MFFAHRKESCGQFNGSTLADFLSARADQHGGDAVALGKGQVWSVEDGEKGCGGFGILWLGIRIFIHANAATTINQGLAIGRVLNERRDRLLVIDWTDFLPAFPDQRRGDAVALGNGQVGCVENGQECGCGLGILWLGIGVFIHANSTPSANQRLAIGRVLNECCNCLRVINILIGAAAASGNNGGNCNKRGVYKEFDFHDESFLTSDEFERNGEENHNSCLRMICENNNE